MNANIWKYLAQVIFYSMGVFIVVSLESCQPKDDVAPIITLKGVESVNHALNQEYVDAGATALDETDGDISDKLYVVDEVNVDYFGDYFITYNCVDEAGNIAIPVSRSVRVINTAYARAGTYSATEIQVFPKQDTCFYNMYFSPDFGVNNRFTFTSFACETGLLVFADLNNELIVIPFQNVVDSTQTLTFQGSGYINDTIIYVEYRKVSDSITSYWNATFIKQL